MQHPDRVAQMRAILGPDIFRWAVGLLAPGTTIDDVRYSDLIDVSEEQVLDYVMEHGFDDRVVSEGRVEDDRVCVVEGPGGWAVFHFERGQRSEEARFARRGDAVREVVRRQLRHARTLLNHRYWHAHGLPFPCSDE